MYPISPLNAPSAFDDHDAGVNPRRPASRMDIERHRLVDKRASYVRTEADGRKFGVGVERKSYVMTLVQSFRVSVANMLIAAGKRIYQNPAAESEPVPFQQSVAEPADTAVIA